MTVYLGAPEPSSIGISDRPLFVSHNRLRRIQQGFGFPVSHPGSAGWVLDSGAYDLITSHGRHVDSAEQYVRAVRGYVVRIGNLHWAAPQDWCCEPAALARSGGTVTEHQELSVQSYLDCEALWERWAPDRASPFRPALQGMRPSDYLRCWDLFELCGVDLTRVPLIAVGSVCGRERTDDIAVIVAALRERYCGRLHGFGVKSEAIPLFDDTDSMAWSKAARARRVKHPDCTQFHPVCSSCLVYAEAWHDQISARYATGPGTR